MHDEIPAFSDAVVMFQRFLAERECGTALVWVFRDDLWQRSMTRIVANIRPTAENAELAASAYAAGRSKGVVEIVAIGTTGNATLASVWYPKLPEETIQGWERGFKRSIREPLPRVRVVGPFVWALVRRLPTFKRYQRLESFIGTRRWAADNLTARIERERTDGTGTCEQCHASFGYYLIHNGFNDTAFAYCDRCGLTAFVGGWDDRSKPTEAPLRIHGPITRDMEPWLEVCECGGHFRSDAAPRCPECQRPLSAAAAASWIERNAAGTKGGWRWQRHWNGVYCVVINGRKVTNNWVTHNTGTD